MTMSKAEQEIVDILNKMGTNKFVMPSGWSDDRQLGTANISYKTYDGGGGYKNLDFTIEDVSYSVQLRYGSIVLEAPLSKPLSAYRLLDIIKTIYQEATSPESIVEGEANLRAKIAEAKKAISDKKKTLFKLEGELNGNEENTQS